MAAMNVKGVHMQSLASTQGNGCGSGRPAVTLLAPVGIGYALSGLIRRA